LLDAEFANIQLADGRFTGLWNQGFETCFNNNCNEDQYVKRKA